MSKTSFVFLLGGMLALSGCSSTNVSGEWDCPRQLGHGCITIDEADQIAIRRLENKEQFSDAIMQKKIIEKKERKVWLAPHTDKSGNKHEASTAYYYEEIPGDKDAFISSVVEQGDIEELQ
jgi:hypothetical protein